MKACCSSSRALALLALITIVHASAAGAETLTIAWDPSVSPGVNGYLVYVGTQPGIYTHTFDAGGSTSFRVTDATPGQIYYMAVAAYGAGIVGDRSAEITGIVPPPVLSPPEDEGATLREPPEDGGATVLEPPEDGGATVLEPPPSESPVPETNLPPTLQAPGNQTTQLDASAILQLVGSDPEQRPLTFAASGLPPGLTIGATSGLIVGIPSSPGTYKVTATVSDGLLQSRQTFTWSVKGAKARGKPRDR